MASGYVSYCAFDAMYAAFAAVEFLRRWTGIGIPVGGGEYCDAREPGLYAAMEGATMGVTCGTNVRANTAPLYADCYVYPPGG